MASNLRAFPEKHQESLRDFTADEILDGDNLYEDRPAGAVEILTAVSPGSLEFHVYTCHSMPSKEAGAIPFPVHRFEAARFPEYSTNSTGGELDDG